MFLPLSSLDNGEPRLFHAGPIYIKVVCVRQRVHWVWCPQIFQHLLLLLIYLDPNTGASQTSQVMPVVKNLPANIGYIRDTGSVPGLGRSPGGGHGNPL